MEFQKRSLLYTYIFLIVKPRNAINIPEKVNKAVSASLPNRDRDPTLYNLVKTYIIYKRYNISGTSTKYYNRNGKCSKRYPKDCRNDTLLIPDRGFPAYARPKILPREDDLDNLPDNYWVVLYNL